MNRMNMKYVFLFLLLTVVLVSLIMGAVQLGRQQRIRQSASLSLPTRWLVIKKEASLDFADVFSFSLSPAAMEQFIQKNYLSPNAVLITGEPAIMTRLVPTYMRNASSDVFLSTQLTDDRKPRWEVGTDIKSGRVVVVLY